MTDLGYRKAPLEVMTGDACPKCGWLVPLNVRVQMDSFPIAEPKNVAVIFTCPKCKQQGFEKRFDETRDGA